MYLIGKKYNDTRFKLIYGIFKDQSKAELFLKNAEEKLNIIEFKDLNFPFFLIGELAETYHSCYPINKDELKKRIEGLIQSNDSKAIYFNLWRIDDDSYNKNYPNQPILCGRDWHLHFTDHDIQQIEKDGFEKYWYDLLND